MKNIVLMFLSLFICLTAVAQESKISGTVTDAADGLPMIGVNVQIKGTTIGTITDADGTFSLQAPSHESVLLLTSIGYKPIELKIGNKRIFKIKMEEDAELLDEIVVVGYGTQRKKDLSGAVSQLKSDDLMKSSPADFSKGMQGKIAGVIINQNDGAPGAGVSIQIRGTNSFTTSSQPLYIIDGIPFDTPSTPTSDANTNNNQTANPLALINPNDIQSIDVLKDASATAIYGSRGANGVVLITTKRGVSGSTKVEVSTNFSFSHTGKRVKMLDAVTYADYINEQTINSFNYSNKPYTNLPYCGKWTYPVYSDGTLNYGAGKYTAKPSDFRNPGIYTDEYGNETQIGRADWQDVIYQTGFSQEYNLSVSGGSDKGYFAFSGNYLDQEGTIKNSGFTRYTLRSNISRNISNWLQLGLNMSFTNTDTDFAKTNAYDYGIIRSALIFPPTYDPYMDTSVSDELNWLAANPYMYVNSAKDKLNAMNVFNSSFAEITIFPFLKFKQNLGLNHSNSRRNTYYNRHTQEGKAPINGYGGQADSWWTGVTTESILTFDKRFKQIHSVNAMGGFTYEKANYGYKSMTATNFPNDITGEMDMSQGLNPGPLSSGRGDNTLVSFLARVNYSLKDRYYLTASYRRDGSSKFIEKNKWANFPSAALAWRISEERFVRENTTLFSNIKLRVSYGETGNQGISSYRTLSMLEAANYPFSGVLNSGFAEPSWRGPVSSDLKWETTSQVNAGLDIGILNNKVNLTVDYYYKRTRDLLQEIQIPPSTGFSSMMINSGHVTNEGIEVSGDFFVMQTKDFKWNMNANISFNRNKIGGLKSDQYANALWYSADQVFIQRNGCPIGAIFGYVEDGFYDNEAEVRANPLYTQASDAVVKSMIGEIKYRNFDDDPNITDADRVIIGNTNPDFVYGITTNFSWKNLSLNMFFQGVHGNDIFNGNLLDVQMSNIGNIPEFAYNSRWTAENAENARWPKAVSGYERTIKLSDRFIEDGSYFRLKSMTLAYDWKSTIKGINSVRFFATATNLFTITNYSWFDPDVNAFGSDSSRKGVDIYSYPSSRTYSFGLKVEF